MGKIEEHDQTRKVSCFEPVTRNDLSVGNRQQTEDIRQHLHQTDLDDVLLRWASDIVQDSYNTPSNMKRSATKIYLRDTTQPICRRI